MTRWMVPVALAACLFTALPAAASTMPRADFGGINARYFGIGIGNGLGVSLDVALNRQFSLGGSIGSGVLGTIEANRYDIRGLYAFVPGGRRNLSIAGILGLWGGTSYSTQYLEVGVGLAYPFTPLLTGRLNLVVPFYGLLAGPYYNTWGGPAGGIELAYKFQPHLEGTIGSNGQGNLLGLKLDF